MSSLAIFGGHPVRTSSSWNRWPAPSDSADRYVREALGRSQLSVRSQWREGLSFDDRLTAAFAKYHGVDFAVPVNTGTTAIEVALEALGVGQGDEVIMPALTWIATAIAALRLNAVPVFVDVDPINLTIDPAAVEAAITERTAVILPVHWHCTVADVETLRHIADRHSVALVEDCAQAHGARFRGKGVGTWGHAGAFSFHNDKLISSGEGGIIVTNSMACHADAQALRLDGFDWSATPTPFVEGIYAQGEVGRIMGTSLALNELCCAVALAGLEDLDRLTSVREVNGERLCQAVGGIAGVAALPRADGLDRRAFYEFVLTIDDDHPLGSCGSEAVGKAIAAELGFPVYPETQTLTDNVLYRPHLRRRYGHAATQLSEIVGAHNSAEFPAASRAATNVLLFLHPPLTGTTADIDDIAAAIERVSFHADDLLQAVRSDDGRLEAPLPYLERDGTEAR